MSAPQKKLTLLDATLLTMGGIIGVGIFLTPQFAASLIPDTAALLSVWVFGGLIALCAAFTFAELGAAFPHTGGWFLYLRESFGPFPAFLFAWVVLGVVSTGATAAVTMFCASQLAVTLPGWIGAEGVVSERALAIGILVGLTLLGLSGVKRSAVVQNLCMVTKLLALAGLVLCGFVFLGESPESVAQATAAPAAVEGSLLEGWLTALLPVFFAYGGWQMVAYIAPEVEDPVRTLPRAIVLGVIGVVTVYFLANLSFVLVLGVDGLAADPNFAANIAAAAFGENGRRILAAAMAVSALGWCIVNIVSAPWLYVAMAREGLFFESLGTLHPRHGVPSGALVVQALISCGYLFASLDFLVSATVFVEWVFHGLVAFGLIVLRRSAVQREWPYRSPLFPLAPLVYGIAAIVVVGNTLWSAEDQLRLTGIGIVGAGCVAYWLWNRLGRRAR